MPRYRVRAGKQLGHLGRVLTAGTDVDLSLEVGSDTAVAELVELVPPDTPVPLPTPPVPPKPAPPIAPVVIVPDPPASPDAPNDAAGTHEESEKWRK